MGGVSRLSTSPLMAAVFTPIGLSVYDILLLPTYTAFKERRSSGQSLAKTLCGILLTALMLPVTILMALTGFSFKGADAATSIIERETTRKGESMMSAEASTELFSEEGSPPGLHDHQSGESTTTTTPPLPLQRPR